MAKWLMEKICTCVTFGEKTELNLLLHCQKFSIKDEKSLWAYMDLLSTQKFMFTVLIILFGSEVKIATYFKLSLSPEI